MANVAREERQVLLLCFLTDLLIFSIGLHAASLTILDTLPFIDVFDLQRDRALCILIFAVALLLSGSYNSWRITDRFDSIYYMLLALAFTGVALLALATLASPGVRAISRRELVLGVVLAVPLLTAWRYVAARFIAKFGALHRFFCVVGTEPEARRVAEAIQKDSSLYASARYLPLEEFARRATEQGGDQTASPASAWDAIVILTSEDRHRLVEFLGVCERQCRRTFFCPSPDDMLLFQHRNLFAVAGIPLVEVATQQEFTPYLFVKRAMDFFIAFAGLLLSSPICIVTALAIKLTSPGPIFYAQERLGKGGRPFKVYKFRSMVAYLEAKDKTGHVLAVENDARITPVGRFIRKHRIDEIPQLFNVLKGDMSMIGPRPVWREYYEVNRRDLPMIEMRLTVRPGLTSLSHILGSYTSEPRDRLRYDLAYISTVSLLTDLKILFETVRIVLSGKGAQ